MLSASTARRMLADTVDARLVELAETGHAVMLDAARALGDALIDFLD